MNIDTLIASDLKALAADSERRLPGVAETARWLEASRGRPNPRRARRALRLALGAGLSLGALLVPLPYRQTAGWVAVLEAPDGGRFSVELPRGSEAVAERRAQALARSLGARVELSRRSELVWGSVYAMARERLFHVDVVLEGKTDSEVEDDIRAQLDRQGWAPEEVSVERDDGSTAVHLRAEDGAGRGLHLERRALGAPNRLQLEPVPIDDAREPGMSDEQLREKILRQLRERGLEGEVRVEGERVGVRVIGRRKE